MFTNISPVRRLRVVENTVSLFTGGESKQPVSRLSNLSMSTDSGEETLLLLLMELREWGIKVFIRDVVTPLTIKTTAVYYA